VAAVSVEADTLAVPLFQRFRRTSPCLPAGDWLSPVQKIAEANSACGHDMDPEHSLLVSSNLIAQKFVAY
jgi:hypothetical protein